MEDCCANDANLDATREREDLVVKVCRVCGRRHIEFDVDAGLIGVTGT